MRGIILAAGSGRRMEGTLRGKPKCLLELGGKTLVRRQIDAMKAAGADEFVVVVGYEQGQVRDAIQLPGPSVRFVENPVYMRTNTLYSLWLAREFMDDDFVYFNGDILCDYRTVEAVAGGGGRPSRLACCARRCGDEEVKVVVQSGRITEIGKHIDPAGAFGEFIGVACFRKGDNALFREVLDRCAADESLWGSYFEYAVNMLAQEKTLECADISGLPATEIDFPKDLEAARREVLPRLLPPP
jgi:choline kinase